MLAMECAYEGAALDYDPPVAKPSFRSRLSGLFVEMRVLRKGWANVNQARLGTGLSQKAVENVEAPEGNPELVSLTRYANALGYALQDMLVAAAHPESEDAFGHPDVQKFIRVWKQSSAEQRVVLMRSVVIVEGLLQAEADLPTAPTGTVGQAPTAGGSTHRGGKTRPRG